MLVEAANPSRSHNGIPGMYMKNLSFFRLCNHAGAGASRDKNISHSRKFHNRHVRQFPDPLLQYRGDFFSRNIFVETYSRPRMRSLPSVIQAAVRIHVKTYSQFQEMIYHSAAGTYHNFNAFFPVLVMSGFHRILKVGFIILFIPHYTDAALGQHRIAVFNSLFRKHQYFLILRQAEGRIKTRYSAAGNHNIVIKVSHHNYAPLSSGQFQHSCQCGFCRGGKVFWHFGPVDSCF